MYESGAQLLEPLLCYLGQHGVEHPTPDSINIFMQQYRIPKFVQVLHRVHCQICGGSPFAITSSLKRSPLCISKGPLVVLFLVSFSSWARFATFFVRFVYVLSMYVQPFMSSVAIDSRLRAPVALRTGPHS